MKNFKKLFSIVAIVAMLGTSVPTATLGAASYSDELQGAYDYASTNGITTQSTIESANMYGSLTRVAMAKMMANYAIEVKGMTPDTTKACSFSDVSAALDAQYDNGVTKACQLGLMGVGITAFNPNGLVNRAMFGTVLDRVLNGDANDGSDPYYADHLSALKDAGIMTNISNPNALEVRGYVMLMMQRADEGTTPAVCETPENVLSCSLGLDTCPAECEQAPEITTKGTLNVSLGYSVKSTVPGSVPGVEMGKLVFKAGNEDVILSSITMKAKGYGAYTNLDSVYLENTDGSRVTRQRNVDTDGNLVLDFVSNYTLKANETATFLIANTINGGANGDTYGYSVESITGPVSVSGLPVSTELVSQVTIASLGALELTESLATVDPKIGADEKLGSFKIASDSNNEDVRLYSLVIKQEGTIDMANLTNLHLVLNGETITSSTTKVDGKYITLTFKDGGYVILKSRTSPLTINLMGTVAGDPGKTTHFVIDKQEDLIAKGERNGYRVSIATTPSSTYFADLSDLLSIASSEIQVSFDKTVDTTTLQTVTNFSFGTLKLKALKNNFELETYTIKLTTNDDYATVSDLENVVKNVRLGGRLADTITRTAAKTFEYKFDAIQMNQGVEKQLTLTADLKDAAVTQTLYFDLSFVNSKFKLVDVDSDLSYTTVAAVTNILSTTSIDTRTVAIASAGITLSVTPMVTASHVVANNKTITVAQGRLEAGTTADVKITSITFTDAGTVADLNTFVSSAKLKVGTDTYSSTSIGASTIVFDREITIKKGSTNRQNYEVVLTLKKGSVALLGTLNFSVAAVGDVVAEDGEGRVLAAGAKTVPATSFGTFTLLDRGTVTVDMDVIDDNASVYTKYIHQNKYVIAGNTGVHLAKIKVFAEKEDSKIKDIAFTLTTDNSANLIASLNDIKLVNGDLSYSASISSVDGTHVKAMFSDVNTVVAQGGAKYLYLVANYNGIDPNGATSTTVAGTTAQVTDVISANTRVLGYDSSNDLTVAASTVDSKTSTVVANVPTAISLASALNPIYSVGAYKLATLNVTVDSQTVNKNAAGEVLKATLKNLLIKFGRGNGVSAGGCSDGVTATQVACLAVPATWTTPVNYFIKKVGGTTTAVLTDNTASSIAALGTDAEVVGSASFEIWANVTQIGTLPDNGGAIQVQVANTKTDIVLDDGTTTANTYYNGMVNVSTNLTVSSK